MNAHGIDLALAIALVGVLAGCAATYAGPTAAPQSAEARFPLPKADLFKAVRRALVADGDQILSADEASGTISTVARDYRLTPAVADCGTTMGIDYLKDNRTSSKLAYGVVVDDGTVIVRAQWNWYGQ